MCLLCAPLSRRLFCLTAAALPLPLAARPMLVEPELRLPPSPSRTVAVTLDACPGAFDPRIAGVLVGHAIPATIFVTAIWMRENPGALAFLQSRPDLFTLENHGARHLPAVLGSTGVFGLAPAGSLPAITREVLQGAAAIAVATGSTPRWYRGAAGLYSPEALPLIESLDVKIAGYSLNADEGASLPAAHVAARLAMARDGDVIIGHINRPDRASGAGIAEGLIALKTSGVHFAKL